MSTVHFPAKVSPSPTASVSPDGLAVGLRGRQRDASTQALLSLLGAISSRITATDHTGTDDQAPLGLCVPAAASALGPLIDTTTVTPVRARRGIWSSLRADIDVLIVAVPTVYLLGRTGQVQDMANAIARRLGRRRVRFAVMNEPRIAAALSGGPLTPLADLSRELCTEPHKLDVIVTCHSGAAVLAATAQALAGCAHAGARLRVDGQNLVFETTDTAEQTLAPLHALELLLRCTGLDRAAADVGREYAALLQAGWGTPGSPNLKPYGRTVSTCEFLEELLPRVGQRRPAAATLRLVR